MKNRIRTLLIILLIIALALFLWYGKFDCPIKKHFTFSCPSCGMNRAFNEILSLHIMNSFNYNILALPLFIITILSLIFLLYDLIKGTNKFLPKLFQTLQKHYPLILLIILINWGINLYRNI